jgi:hypothetical protein
LPNAGELALVVHYDRGRPAGTPRTSTPPGSRAGCLTR